MPQPSDAMCGGHSAYDFAVLTVALAQQDGRRRVPVGNGFDIHGGIRAWDGGIVQVSRIMLHGYILDGFQVLIRVFASG